MTVLQHCRIEFEGADGRLICKSMTRAMAEELVRKLVRWGILARISPRI